MKTKKNEGITLIALVITIIVMLILVGVTLNITLDENGIIEKTKKARRLQEEEFMYEQVLAAMIYDRTGVNLEDTKSSISALGYDCGVISNNQFIVTATGKYGTYRFIVTKNGITKDNSNIPEPPVDTPIPYSFKLKDFTFIQGATAIPDYAIPGGPTVYLYIMNNSTFYQTIGAEQNVFVVGDYGINTANGFAKKDNSKNLICSGEYKDELASSLSFYHTGISNTDLTLGQLMYTFWEDTDNVYIAFAEVGNRNLELPANSELRTTANYDDIVFTFEGTDSRVTVASTLTNISSSNASTKTAIKTSYTTTLTPANHYMLPENITVTMGGTELVAGTGYTYDSATGELTIDNVTGNISITAEGVFDPSSFSDLELLRVYFVEDDTIPANQKISNGVFANTDVIPDAETSILLTAFGIDPSEFYITYKENYYKVGMSRENFVSVSSFYIGDAGKYVYYNYDGNHSSSKWIVLYDNSGENMQIMSLEAIGNSFEIGINDDIVSNYVSAADLDGNMILGDDEKMIYSWNNISSTMDSKSKEVVTETTFAESNLTRNILSTTQISDKVRTTDIQNYSGNWFDKYNGVIEKNIETNVEDQFRMSLFRVTHITNSNTEVKYFDGAQFRDNDDNRVYFSISGTKAMASWTRFGLFSYDINGNSNGNEDFWVRPVVTLKSNVTINTTSGEGTAESPYTLQVN